MKEIYLKIIRFSISFLMVFFTLFLISKSEILEKIFLELKFQKEVEQIKEKIDEVKEIPKKLEPAVGEKIENLPKTGLRLEFEIESKINPQNSFFANLILDNNNLYWKIIPKNSQQGLPFSGFLFEWRKYQLKEDEFDNLKELKEILEEKKFFEKFEKKNEEYEFRINKEKLKDGILEWKKEIPPKDLENFFENIGEISGKIYIDDENFMKGLELEDKNIRIIAKIENLDKDILQKEGENLEKFLTSILKIF